MTRELADAALVLLGITVWRVVSAGAHTAYVRPGWGLALQVAAVLAVAVGALDLGRVLVGRDGPEAPEDGGAVDDDQGHDDDKRHGGQGHDVGHGHGHGHDHGHDHSRAPAVASLLVLPVMVFYLVSPPALSTFMADREAPRAEVVSGMPPLEASEDGVASTDVLDVVQRMWSAPDTLAEVPVRLLGFVAAGEETPRSLARITMSCCAADGRPVKVDLTGPAADDLPAAGSWVEVTARWSGTMVDAAQGVPETVLVVESVVPAQEPAEPYLL